MKIFPLNPMMIKRQKKNSMRKIWYSLQLRTTCWIVVRSLQTPFKLVLWPWQLESIHIQYYASSSSTRYICDCYLASPAMAPTTRCVQCFACHYGMSSRHPVPAAKGTLCHFTNRLWKHFNWILWSRYFRSVLNALMFVRPLVLFILKIHVSPVLWTFSSLTRPSKARIGQIRFHISSTPIYHSRSKFNLSLQYLDLKRLWTNGGLSRAHQDNIRTYSMATCIAQSSMILMEKYFSLMVQVKLMDRMGSFKLVSI